MLLGVAGYLINKVSICAGRKLSRELSTSLVATRLLPFAADDKGLEELTREMAISFRVKTTIQAVLRLRGLLRWGTALLSAFQRRCRTETWDKALNHSAGRVYNSEESLSLRSSLRESHHSAAGLRTGSAGIMISEVGDRMRLYIICMGIGVLGVLAILQQHVPSILTRLVMGITIMPPEVKG